MTFWSYSAFAAVRNFFLRRREKEKAAPAPKIGNGAGVGIMLWIEPSPASFPARTPVLRRAVSLVRPRPGLVVWQSDTASVNPAIVFDTPRDSAVVH